MDIKNVGLKTIGFLKKYKYAAIVLLIGIALMLLPNVSKTKDPIKSTTISSEPITSDLHLQLENVLSRVAGAGKVEVMLTVAKGQQTIYQTNTNHSNNTQSNDIKSDTVILTDSSRNEYGLIKRVDPVQYLGAIVLCQGADSPTVRLAIIEAVSKVTGLGADHICVLKMK